MIFNICSTYRGYRPKILEDYPKLEVFGFKVEEIKDENKKRILPDGNPTIEIHTLDDLLALVTDVDEPVIINTSWLYDDRFEIEIYDDYRE